MSLLQIGTFAIHGQGHRGIFYERISHRMNLKTAAGKACVAGGLCVDHYEDRYKIYFRGCGDLSVAQDLAAALWNQICRESGFAYFRRRIVEDANLEVYKVKSGQMDETDFRLNYTDQRTLAIDLTLKLEPLTPATLATVIAGDIEVGP